MIAPGSELSIARQAKLLNILRSSVYDRPKPESQEERDLLERLDELFTENPMYGGRLQAVLKREGILVGRRRIRRLMKKLGLWAVGPKPDTSKPHPEHKVYSYLLRGLLIDWPNQVWATDITYMRMRHGFLYLCAIMDWATRKVLSWRLSNTLTSEFCSATLKEALARYGTPEIFKPTRAADSPAPNSPVCSRRTRSRSAWTVADGVAQQKSLGECFDCYDRKRPIRR